MIKLWKKRGRDPIPFTINDTTIAIYRYLYTDSDTVFLNIGDVKINKVLLNKGFKI